jgi:hypothetical protein
MKPKNLLPNHVSFKIGGITLSIQSDLPLKEGTFASKFELFRCHNSGGDRATIHHHCGFPRIRNWGEEVYQRAPWIIYKRPSHYIYQMFVDGINESPLIAIFSKDHSEGHIYKGENYVKAFRKGNLTSLLCFPTDQILFARLLADRGGIILHGSGIILKEKGYLFVGHSDAGKTTLVKIKGNRIERTEGLEAFKRLYGCTIKPLVTERWAKNALDICQALSREAAYYDLYFDKTEGVISTIEKGVRS